MLSKIPVDLQRVSEEDIDKEILRAAIIAELDAVNLYEQMAGLTKNQIAGGHPNLKDGVCKGRPPLSWNCLVFYDKTSLT